MEQETPGAAVEARATGCHALLAAAEREAGTLLVQVEAMEEEASAAEIALQVLLSGRAQMNAQAAAVLAVRRQPSPIDWLSCPFWTWPHGVVPTSIRSGLLPPLA